MSFLMPYDVDYVTNSLPKVVVRAMKGSTPVFLAGGFIRARIAKETPNDIDLFTSSKEEAATIMSAITGGADVYETENALSCRLPSGMMVQVIHRWVFKTPIECIDSFDFTIAKAAIWWDGLGWKSACDSRFYPDLAAKRLVYCSPIRNEDAGGSILRLLKFHLRGYSAPLSTTGAVIARLLEGVDKGTSMWQGTEDDRAKVVTGLLREVDPMAAMNE